MMKAKKKKPEPFTITPPPHKHIVVPGRGGKPSGRRTKTGGRIRTMGHAEPGKERSDVKTQEP